MMELLVIIFISTCLAIILANTLVAIFAVNSGWGRRKFCKECGYESPCLSSPCGHCGAYNFEFITCKYKWSPKITNPWNISVIGKDK